MWNKIQRIYIGIDQVRPIKILTFDFVNNWQQNWGNLTWFSTYSSYWGFSTWEWFYLRKKSGSDGDAWFTTIPSWLTSGTLTKIKLWYYLPNSSTWAWINDNWSVSSGYTWAHNDKLWFGSSTPATIWNYTWELMTEYNITPTGCSWTCAWVPFTFTNSQANNFITAYTNGTLRLYLVQRGSANNCYLRKVELTVLPN